MSARIEQRVKHAIRGIVVAASVLACYSDERGFGVAATTEPTGRPVRRFDLTEKTRGSVV